MQCSSASRCEEAKTPLLLIRSHRLAHIVLHSSFYGDRAMLTNALIDALGLLAKLHVQESSPAPLQALLEYHTPEYLHALAASRTLHLQKLARFGLEDDCAPFPALLEYSCLCAGGSLQAAAALNARTHQFAVHFDGGRHHARKARAAGFCWINDVVLAILHLLRAHKRVLYIDLDVHHGDAVEEAFATSDRVLTLSLHRFAPGYFPGSGALGAGGSGAGAGFALNLPLGEGLRDDVFVDAVTTLTHGAIEVFDPEVVVAQCGCDGLAGDPVGRSWAVSLHIMILSCFKGEINHHFRVLHLFHIESDYFGSFSLESYNAHAPQLFPPEVHPRSCRCSLRLWAFMPSGPC
jgi:acetoin utilization deacetylase AcuC-like enzyme